MTAHRIFTPHNPLADRLHDSRGLDAVNANLAAAIAVKRCEPEGVTEIKRALALLAKDLVSVRSTTPSADFTLAQVYAGADVIAGLAATFGRPRLGEAASSLCKLVTEQRGSRADAIAVHIDAMMMIIRDDCLGEVLLPDLQQLHDTYSTAREVETTAATRPMALSRPPDSEGQA